MAGAQGERGAELYSREPRARAAIAMRIGGERALARIDVFRDIFLPPSPDIATLTAAGNWPRRNTRAVWQLLDEHLAGGRAVGGVHRAARVLVQDLDAGAGVPLQTRVRVARMVAPQALLLRSSTSGGLHAVSVFGRAHPTRAVLHLAHERLRKAAAMIDEDLYRRLAGSPIEGVNGLYELHPRPFRQGSVIRVPFGPGSRIVDDDLRPLHSSPDDGLRLFSEWLEAQTLPLELHDAFPLDEVARVVLPVAPPMARPTRRPPAVREGVAADLGLLRRADGRLPPEARASIEDCRAYCNRLEQRGFPRDGDKGTRHDSSFPLAYVAVVGDGLDVDAAMQRIWPIMDSWRATSKDLRIHPVPTKRRTRAIVQGYYDRRLARGAAAGRPLRLIHGGKRYRDPCPVHLSDWVHTLDLFAGDGYLAGTWLRILRFAKANRREVTQGSGYWVSPLPLEQLQLRTSRGRAALARFRDLGLIVEYRPAVKKVRHDGRGEWRQLRAAEYRIRWRFLEAGPEVVAPRPLSSIAATKIRAKVKLLIARHGAAAQQFVNPPAALGGETERVAAGGSGDMATPAAQAPIAGSYGAVSAGVSGSHLPREARPAAPEPAGKRPPIETYVEGVLARARAAAGIAGPGARAIALRFWNDRLPLEAVEAGILLGVIRRRLSDPAAPSIGSLAYFTPVIDEILEAFGRTASVPTLEYCDHLRRWRARLDPPELVLTRPTSLPHRRTYERAVIRLYTSLPGTPARAGKADWREAHRLYRAGVPLEAVRAGIVEALAFRLLRATPVPGRVRTLHYFGRAIAAATATPDLGVGRTDHLLARLLTLVDR